MTRLNKFRYFPIFIVTFIGIVFQSYAQCPIVTDSTQTFCDIPTPLISNLVATDTGGGIAWYATDSATTPINSSTPLVNGRYYFAGDVNGNCDTRPSVRVVIVGPPRGPNFQGVCVDDPNDAIIADLLVIGNDVAWYSTPVGGVALPWTTVLTDNTIYYADQANLVTGCRTSRLAVSVHVGVIPVPTGDAVQEFCNDLENPPTVADLEASGDNRWYATSTSAAPLDPSTPLVDGANYYATTVDAPPCESEGRFEVLVVFTPPNDSGEDGTIHICETEITTIQSVDLFPLLGGTPWSNGTWTGPFITTNGETGTVDISAMTLAGSPYIFTYTVSSSTKCPPSTSTVSIIIEKGPDAGIDSTLEICGDGLPVDLFTILGGTPDPGGAWSPSLASGTGIFDPTIDNSGIYTYTVMGIPPCGSDSATITVIIPPDPDAGIDSTVDLCNNDSPLDLFTTLGGTPDVTGIWSPPLASGTGIFNPVIDSPGIYTYTVSSPLHSCNDDSAEVLVTVIPAPNAGIDAAIDICSDDDSMDLFTILGGTPDLGGTWNPPLFSGTGVFNPLIDTSGIYIYTVAGVLPCGDNSASVTVNVVEAPNAGNDAIVSFCNIESSLDLYTYLEGSPDTGGSWSPSLASGTNIFDPEIDGSGIYTYTVAGTAPCESDSATIEVTVIPAPNAGISSTLLLCSDGNTTNLFAALDGTPDAGGTWSPPLISGSEIFDPTLDAPGVYTYTVIGNLPCADDSATVTVTIDSAPNAGTDTTINLCENGIPTDLFTVLGGTPDLGGTWSPILNSGSGIFDPTIDASGEYTYTVYGIPPCSDNSATVTVTVISSPNAGLDNTLEVCSNDSSVDLFTLLGGSPDSGGSWSPSLASGTSIFNPAIDPSGVYTYTMTGTLPCGDDSATITVTVIPAPNAGIDSTLNLCENNVPIDLFLALDGNPDNGGSWSPSLASGTNIFDPAIDSAGDYIYTVFGTPPCGNKSATISVTLVPAANAGLDGNIEICSNHSPLDLFTILGGTPDFGGSWNPSLASGTGIFDPTIDSPGVYTYTVSGNPPCGNDIATVTVAVIPQPFAGTNNTLDICSNDSPIDLFTILGGTPDLGGSWSPSLASGSGVFDPSIDVSGSYTYTVTGTPPCNGLVAATIIVTIIAAPNAGIDENLSLCSDDAPIDLFTVLDGTPDLGGTWNPALASGTGIFDPSIDLPGEYVYTVRGIVPCANASASVTVTVIPPPNAGNDGFLNLCSADSPVDLFTILGGTPDLGGTWSPTLSSGTGIFNPAIDPPGLYTYTVIGAPPCIGNDSAFITVIITPEPDASGINMATENRICLDSSIEVEVSGALFLTDGLYSITYELTGANSIVNTIDVTFYNGNTNFTIPASELSNAGQTTITINDLFIVGNNCNANVSSIEPVSFLIETTPTQALVPNGNEFCVSDNPTIADLSANIINPIPTIIWYDAPEDGNVYSETTPLINGETYYGSAISQNGCESEVRLEVTISIIDCNPQIIIPDGFSPNGDGINDTFLIQKLRELYPNFTLEIYNRYGNILYRGNNKNSDWDGTSNIGIQIGNSELPVGVYFYILNFNKDDKKPYQGRVYLSR